MSLSPSSASASSSFAEFALDPRIQRALTKLKYTAPTKVQSKVIPLGLEGKDILARAATGSGKTLAFILPILQGILSSLHVSSSSAATGDRSIEIGIKALILVPTKELAHQIRDMVEKICLYCSKIVSCYDVTGDDSLEAQKTFLSQVPDIVISTPSRILPHINSDSQWKGLKYLVVDEADLIFSFGYKKDMEKIFSLTNTASSVSAGELPSSFSSCQTFLMSATLSADLDGFKSLVLKNPVLVDVDDEEEQRVRLKQTFMQVLEEKDKFLLVYVLLKLKLIRGKWIIFVNDIDHGYRLKLFLEKFSIKTCLLNSELPGKSRYHVVEEFNRGVYDYIIATDTDMGAAEDDLDLDAGKSAGLKRKKEKKKIDHQDGEFGVARGIDFKNVSMVLNFDVPKSSKAYQHRIGRTARGKSSGMALTLTIAPREENEKSLKEGKRFERIQMKQQEKGSSMESFPFDLKLVEGFRYRSESTLQTITKNCIKEARFKEIRNEIMNSEKLKSHFMEKPKDLQILRHDKILTKDVPSHLKHIPDYILPSHLRKESIINPVSGSNPQKTLSEGGGTSNNSNNQRKRRRFNNSNPLKSFKLKSSK